MIPNDPFILLSYINTLLRDEFSSPEELCRARDIDLKYLTEKLGGIGYEYNPASNQYR